MTSELAQSDQDPHHQTYLRLGIGMILIAYAFFAFVDTSVKWLALAGLPSLQLAFARYFTHFAISLIALLREGIDRKTFHTAKSGLVILRGMLLVSATALNFVALRYLSLSVISAIMFSAPIIVCALSWPLLGERVGAKLWAAIILGFVGVLVVIRPFGDSFHWAALLICYNALALALYSILTRKLTGVVRTATMQFYAGFLGTITLLPFAIMGWQSPASLFEHILMWALGASAWAGHELLTRAHAYAPANILMPYTYSFLIYLTATGYVIFGEIPDVWTVSGAGIIVLSGIIIWRNSTKSATRLPRQTP
ncbi:MAG: DMT family transporter [Pseudomonadota bacterium]